jgi:predicted GNAT family N-acyltransferase
MHQLEGDIYVKKASVEYFASARYDDQLEIGIRCSRIGTSSIVFEGAIFRDSTLLVTGELLYVFANPVTQRARPVPQTLREVFNSFEAGEPVVTLQTGAWAALQQQASSLRQTVFVQEQGIGANLVWDDADSNVLHAVLTNRLDMPVATGRLVQEAPGVGRVGRMAVERVLRGSKWGHAVLQALIDLARKRGDREVMLHALCSAQGFYERSGFTPRGAVFSEGGLDHIEMVLAL